MIAKMKNHFIQSILDMKFNKKLFLFYFFLIIIPLLTFTLYSHKQLSNIIEENTLYSAEQSLNQAVYFLSSRVNSSMNISDLVALDEQAIQVFRNMTKEYDVHQQMVDFNNLKKSFLNMQRNRDVYRVRLFIPNGLFFSGDRQNFFRIGIAEREAWYHDLTDSSSTILWSPTTCLTINKTGDFDKDRVLSALRFMKNPDDFSQDVAVLSIDILESDVYSIITKAASTTSTGVVYLENSQGVILSSSAQNRFYKWQISNEEISSTPIGHWKEIEMNGESVVYNYDLIENTDWRLVSVIPLKDILSSSSQQKYIMILMMLTIAVIAYILAYLVSISSTKRIYRLIDNMRQVQMGNLNAAIENNSKDEIGQLTEDFNYMIRKIGELIDRQIKIGQEVKDSELKIVQAELKALQSQINPHFLYNTLDIIYWMAIKHDCPDIESTILLLSRFYKLSLSKGKEIVTIGDEVLHIQTFIDIYNIRFENSVRLELDTECVNRYRMPKITLQPLVENAVLHGIQKKPDRVGTISIKGRVDNDTVILSVQDDGAGMEKEQAESILLRNNHDEVHGFGVRNINERLKLYFGNQYGLTYKSKQGAGTIVEIRIPPRLYEDSDSK